MLPLNSLVYSCAINHSFFEEPSISNFMRIKPCEGETYHQIIERESGIVIGTVDFELSCLNITDFKTIEKQHSLCSLELDKYKQCLIAFESL